MNHLRNYFNKSAISQNIFKYFSRSSNSIPMKSHPMNQGKPFYNNIGHKVDVKLTKDVDYFEKISNHRFLLPVYDLSPMVGNSFIAPNATVIGEAHIHDYVTIWHNVVIRGDINVVKIFPYSSIGDRTVINTVSSLPTGQVAIVYIGANVTVQSGCSITSCFIDAECVIGSGSVLMEGCRVERGVVILPNSVVPPGRLIPAGQVWGGNPVEYVRDLSNSEMFYNYGNTHEMWSLGTCYLQQFTPWSYNYLKKESTKEDLDLQKEYSTYVNERPQFRGHPKRYTVYNMA